MLDLEIAKKCLSDRGLTLCIVKDGERVFESGLHGVSRFLEAVDQCGGQLNGASVADRVVGKAVALLCLYANVNAVYARVLSEKARTLFERNKIRVEWSSLVESILDAKGEGTCPFEHLVSGISDPREAYTRLKALHCSLKRNK